MALSEKMSVITEKIQAIDTDKALSALKKCNNKYFFKGLGLIGLTYAMSVVYIAIMANTTLNAIKEKIPSETTPVIFSGQKITQDKTHNASKKKDASLESLIIKGLYQKTKQGLLPVIRKNDNLTSFRAYQAPFDYNKITDTKPVVTFAVMDYGLSKKSSQMALDLLPPEVSFILTPYANLPNEWIKMAQNNGHEVWLNLPIQHKNGSDLGALTIFHHLSLPEKMASLYTIMATTQGYVGFASYTDEQINSNTEHYSQIMNKIYERGLGFLELNPNAPRTLEGTAINIGAPFINADMTTTAIQGDEQSFEQLEKMAKEKGHLIALIPPYEKPLKNLAVWIEKVGKTDYTIAPVSFIYDLPFYQTYGSPNKENKKSDVKHLKPEDHKEPNQNNELYHKH